MEIRSFRSYQELLLAHQKDVEAFPMVFIFGRRADAELQAELAKIGASSLAECVTVYGAGDVMRKVDLPKWTELCRRHEKERNVFAEHGGLGEMIRFEMDNHEYALTRDADEVLHALGKGTSVLRDAVFRKAWDKAEKECMEAAY